MATSRYRLAAAGALFTAVLATAASSAFWHQKPPASWTKEDCRSVLNRSPWARQLDVPETWHSLLQDPAKAGRPTTVKTEPRPAPLQRSLHYLRWHSAPIVREAARQLRLWVPDDAEVERYYVLTAVGLTNLILDAGGEPQTSYRIDSQIEEMRVETTLRVPRTGIRILCERVVWARGGQPVRFYFPKTATQPIRPEDGDVEFDSLLGQTRLRAKFRLKEMIWDGKLAL